MSTSKSIVLKIEGLAEEIRSESMTAPAHIDTILIADLCRELSIWQDMLWEHESPTED